MTPSSLLQDRFSSELNKCNNRLKLCETATERGLMLVTICLSTLKDFAHDIWKDSRADSAYAVTDIICEWRLLSRSLSACISFDLQIDTHLKGYLPILIEKDNDLFDSINWLTKTDELASALCGLLIVPKRPCLDVDSSWKPSESNVSNLNSLIKALLAAPRIVSDVNQVLVNFFAPIEVQLSSKCKDALRSILADEIEDLDKYLFRILEQVSSIMRDERRLAIGRQLRQYRQYRLNLT